MVADVISSERYSRPLILLHWAMFLLIAVAYGLAEWRDFVPKGDPFRDTLMHLHRSLGLLVFALVFIRLALRGSSPPIVPSPPAWQEHLSRLVHWALYAVMLILPVTGYLMSNAADKSVLFFGATMPALIGPDQGLRSFFHETHEVIANLGYGLIGLHAAASLWHHYVQRDNALRRMLPAPE
jgi:cytochrome b561